MNLRKPASLLAASLLSLSVSACATDDAEPSSAAADAASATPEESPEESASEEVDSGADSAQKSDKASTDKAEASAEQPGAWIDYSSYQAERAEYADTDVVLFFHAAWCHECVASEKSLDADGVPDGLTVVKVDYDTQTDLRQRYGVTVQHTFVHVDKDGNELAKWTGTTTGSDIASAI